MEFVKKQAKNAWEFYKNELFRGHLWCIAAFLAVCALSAVVLGIFAQEAQAILESFMEEVMQSGLLKSSRQYRYIFSK